MRVVNGYTNIVRRTTKRKEDISINQGADYANFSFTKKDLKSELETKKVASHVY